MRVFFLIYLIIIIIIIIMLVSCKEKKTEKKLYFSKIENIILLELENENFDINVFNYLNIYEVKLLSIRNSNSFVITYPEFTEICILYKKEFHYFSSEKEFSLFDTIYIGKPEYNNR